jgi:putative transposase
MMPKVVVEAALNVGFDEHLGYSKHEKSESGNNHNGYTSKTLRSEYDQIELSTPRDRHSSFEPRLIKKGQTRFTSMNDKILCLYAKGMTTREIVATFKEMVGADVSATLISNVTKAVIDRVTE